MKPRVALLMLIPALVFFVLTFAAPLVIAGRLSLFEADYVRETWIGLRNFAQSFRDRYFLKSFVNAFCFVGMVAPVLIVTSYSIASYLSGFPAHMQSVGRFLLYIPGLASGIIMTLLWRWLLQREGLINHLLALVRIPAIPWLSEAWPARAAVAMISLVGGIGGTVILFAASMHGLPLDLRDAAQMDGASIRQYKRLIVRPLMTPTILLMLLLNIVGIMQMWETPYVLFQGGGPEGSTSSPVYEIFMTAFMFGKQGYGAAKGILLMFVIAGILVVKQKVEKWVR